VDPSATYGTTADGAETAADGEVVNDPAMSQSLEESAALNLMVAHDVAERRL
jgi:hypothetical protein